ncbi:MAG: penicillin-binding protein 2, partial [Deltaproteobacteria bacterium]|nr:penicillin-binding protein 2 [Deltaproteobacteria bacterium]
MKYSELTSDEIQLFKTRLALIIGLMSLVFFIWVFRLWQMQVLEGNYYDEVARGNRIRVIPQPAPRGIIYDRNGEILAYNRPSFDLQLIRED